MLRMKYYKNRHTIFERSIYFLHISRVILYVQISHEPIKTRGPLVTVPWTILC